eukprot:CAMPEP_0113447554 /NCGR_PEP_ID=MMETSP0014_2-20120614/4296_1 /TAXON_ID=2857 /ORGANISM="Nitzschia sp." /LENGTH=703 /DNA_ID=CAMNT_0000338709 /DNA_START=320 /DNA_END=2431 /DNA_ORIENTATION=- /assembly_acc=CAM_ASM_000159
MGRSTEDEEDRESDFDGEEEEVNIVEEDEDDDFEEEDDDFEEEDDEDDQAADDSEYEDLADDDEEEEEDLAGEEEDEEEEEEDNSDRHMVEDDDGEDGGGEDHGGDDAEVSDGDRPQQQQHHGDDASTDSQGELPWGTLKLNQYEEVFEIDCDFTEEEKEDVWFDKNDYNFFLEDCEELAAQMSSDENTSDGENVSKSSDMIGLEAWTEEGYKKRQKLRLGAIDCVLDEQFAQWDDGNEDHEKIAELYTVASKESRQIANTKALRVASDIKQYIESTEETMSSSSNSSSKDDNDDESKEQTESQKPKKKKKEKIRPAKPSGWDAPLTEKQERHKFSSNFSGTFRQPGRDLDNVNMRPTDIIPVDEYVIPSKKKKKLAEKNAANGIVAPTGALPQISSRGGNHQRPSSLRKSVQGRKKTQAQLKMMKHPPRKHLPLSGSSNHSLRGISNHSLRGTSNHSINSRGGTHPKKHAPKHLPLNKNSRKKLLVNGSNRTLVSPSGVKKVVKKKPQLNTVSAGGATNNGKNALPAKKKKKHLPTNPAAATSPKGFKIVNRSGKMPVSQRKLSTTPTSYRNRPVSSQRSLSSDDSDSGPKKKKVVPKKKKKTLFMSPTKGRPGSVSSLGSISSDDDDDDGNSKGPSRKMSVRKLVPKIPKMFGKGDRQQSVRKAEVENRKLREENERLRIEMENKRLREENERLKRRQQRA